MIKQDISRILTFFKFFTYLIVAFLFGSLPTSAQQIDVVSLASYVYKSTLFIDWSEVVDEKSETFVISYMGDSTRYSDFADFWQDKQIMGKKVEIGYCSNYQMNRSAHIIVIDTLDVDLIASLLSENNICKSLTVLNTQEKLFADKIAMLVGFGQNRIPISVNLSLMRERGLGVNHLFLKEINVLYNE